MGCCLSAGNRNQEADHRRSIDGEPSTSPRAILEVETVKEVLLETPVALAPKADDNIKSMPPENREWKPDLPSPPPPIDGKDGGATASEVTVVSEVCSYGDSLSTTAAQEKGADVDEGVVDQRPPLRKRRAHGGGRGKGERVVGRRVAHPPPEKRGQVAPLKPVRGRPRNGAEENGKGRRKDVMAMEGSGKRSRSETPPRNESDERTPPAAEAPNGVVAAAEAETLENPVVSLECFIFL